MLTARIVDSLEKIFADAPPKFGESSEFTALRGEVVSFQIALYSPVTIGVQIEAVSPVPVTVRAVESVPVRYPGNNPDGTLLRTTAGLYPDLLQELIDGTLKLQGGQWTSLWVTIPVSEEQKAGEYALRFRLHKCSYDWGTMEEELAEVHATLRVLGEQLPKQRLKRLEWVHCDCLGSYYRVSAWSDEHWRIVEAFFRNAYAHGVNVMYTPLWTPPLDTAQGGLRPDCQLLKITYDSRAELFHFDFSRLKRFMEMGRSIGFEDFAMSHLFSQWGARFTPAIRVGVDGEPDSLMFGWHVVADSALYAKFLRQLMPELLAFLRAEGVNEEHCFFSVSDEPNETQLDSYGKAVNLVRPLLEGFPTLEALSRIEFYRHGLVRKPIPSNNHIEAFVGEVSELWTYFCCSQETLVPNRFIALPGYRTRVHGIMAYLYDLRGFLHWGFNFYFSQYSRRQINPYFVTDAEGAFPAGDPFLVYPGVNGQPLDSLRNELFREGLQDLNALRLLETKIGRPAVLTLLQEGVAAPLKMDCYPQSAEWLRNVRRRVDQKLKEQEGCCC